MAAYFFLDLEIADFLSWRWLELGGSAARNSGRFDWPVCVTSFLPQPGWARSTSSAGTDDISAD